MENELPSATWKERLLYFLGRRQAFLVEGRSMESTLRDGDAVLVNPRAKISIGDIVAANHPYKQSIKILKRVGDIDADGSLTLLGDSPDESTDSRTFGPVLAENILGKAVSKLK